MPVASYPVSGLPLSFCILALGRDVIAITSVVGRMSYGRQLCPVIRMRRRERRPWQWPPYLCQVLAVGNTVEHRETGKFAADIRTPANHPVSGFPLNFVSRVGT